MESLKEELILLFKEDSSYNTTVSIDDHVFNRMYGSLSKNRVIAYKLNKGFFNKKSYVFTLTGAYINNNFFTLLGCQSITGSGTKYNFEYLDGVNTYSIDKEVADYLKKMLEVIKKFEQKGDAYAYGINVEKDLDKALYYYGETIGLDYDFDKTILIDFAWGEYRNKKYIHAYAYCLLAKSYNIADAYYTLGVLYQYGLDFPMDLRKAIEYYDEGLKIDPTHSNICYYKAQAHYSLKEYDLCFKSLNQGKDRTQCNNLLGICYDRGYGVEMNPVLAQHYYKEAIKNNCRDAYHNLALNARYLGERKEFYKYANTALEHDVKNAYYLLGYAYHYGFGVEVDYSKAIDNYNKMLSVFPDDYRSYRQLGCIYLYAKEYIDYKKAYDYFMKCYDNGNYFANYELAVMYRDGIYVEQNSLKSKKLLKEGAEIENVACMVTLAVQQIETLQEEKMKKGYEILEKAVMLERDESKAIKTYINIIMQKGNVDTLLDLKNHIEIIYKVYENRRLVIKDEFNQLKDYYVKLIAEVCHISKTAIQSDCRNGSKVKSMYIYSGNKHHAFLTIDSLTIFEVNKDKVKLTNDRLGALYNIVFNNYGVERVEKRLKLDDMIESM